MLMYMNYHNVSSSYVDIAHDWGILVFTDFTFAKYPASMLAAGSVCAAANGVLDFQRCSQLRLLQRLQLITHVDAVSRRACLNCRKTVVCFTFALCATRI